MTDLDVGGVEQDLDAEVYFEKPEIYRFDAKFVNEIYIRDDFQCQICGAENVDPAHIKHRGIGGNPSANHHKNVITFCRYHHDCHDGRVSDKNEQFRVVHFDPDDHETGLIIAAWNPLNSEFAVNEAEDGMFLNGRKLWFYERPRDERGEKYDRLKTELKGLANVNNATIWHIVRRIYQINEEGLYKPAYRSIWDAVNGDMEFLHSGIGWNLSQSSLTKYLRAFKLAECMPVETLESIGVSDKQELLSYGPEKLYHASRVEVDDGQIDILKAIVDGGTQKEIAQKTKEILTGEGIKKSCYNCIHARRFYNALLESGRPLLDDNGQLVADTGVFQMHDAPLKVCPLHKHLIDSMTGKKSIEIAEACSDYQYNG